MSEIRKLPIIMGSMSRWDSPLSSASYSLAKEFARTNKVFYIDYPYTLNDYRKGRKTLPVAKRARAILTGKEIYTEVPEAGTNFRAVTPLVMCPFFALPRGVFDAVVAYNNRRFFKTVRKILKDHNISDFIFFNSYNPFYGYKIPETLRPRYFIYQSRDNLRATPGFEEMGPRYERKAATNADMVFATSGRLCEIISQETGRKVNLLPNAAQIGLFRTALKENLPRPYDFPDNGRKVVGFVGNIGPRMDLPLVDMILETNSDKDFVMIGPDNLELFEGPDLRRHKHLYLLGPKDLSQLPEYLRYMDVTIIPFLKNELTASIYPLKLNEQLAAGKPIVSTDFSEDLHAFADVVYLASSGESFAQMINRALQEDSGEKAEQRLRKAEGNAWADRVEQFWATLEDDSKY